LPHAHAQPQCVAVRRGNLEIDLFPVAALHLDGNRLAVQADQAAIANARAAIGAAQAAVETARAAVQADQAVAENARIQLGYTSIRSPITGRAGQRLLVNFRVAVCRTGPTERKSAFCM
jgi:multidrug resistance efflux pump